MNGARRSRAASPARSGRWRAREPVLPVTAAPEEKTFVRAPCGTSPPWGLRARMFCTISTLGTARDVTLHELRIETFHPAGEEGERQVRAAFAPSPP